MSTLPELTSGSQVRATQSVREINVGDTGEVIASWVKPHVGVRWHKDGLIRSIHRKRLELVT